MDLPDIFIQSNLHSEETLLSGLASPGNQSHDLGTASTELCQLCYRQTTVNPEYNKYSHTQKTHYTFFNKSWTNFCINFELLYSYSLLSPFYFSLDGNVTFTSVLQIKKSHRTFWHLAIGF